MSGYTDREAAEIIRRAAESQESALSEKLSLADVERIGAELGIDPTRVRAAAMNSGAKDTFESIRLERHLSVPLDDQVWAQLVDQMRSRFGSAGTTSMVGEIREWTSGFGVLSANPTSHGVKLTLRVDRSQTIWSTWIIGGFFSLMASVGVMQIALRMGGLAGAIPTLIAMVGALWAVLHFGLKAWAGRNRQSLESFADSLSRTGHISELAIPEITSLGEEELPVSERA